MYKDAKILVIDDNEEILLAIEMLLSNNFGVIRSSKNPNIIPTIVAERSDARVPASSALIPNWDNKTRLPGAKDPIPPICIPIEAKLANPQSI